VPPFRISPKISVSAVYVSAVFMTIMDTTIVNVALPSIGRQFHVSTAALDSVVVGYLVSLAVFIPAAGWLGDRFGPKRVLLVAIALFASTSVMCGLSTTMPQLVAFRVLQGAGGGMMVPVGMAMLFRTFPPEERVRAASVLMVATAMAPALGPILGGTLTTYLSWRWVFLVNLPFGLVAIVFGLLFLDSHRQPRPGAFDLPGFALCGVGFGLVMFGLSEGSNLGWASAAVLGSLVVGAVLLAALVWVELSKDDALLDLRLYANRLFRTATTVGQIGTGAFLGVLFVVPLFLQIGLGLNPLQSGLNTFPEAIGVMIGSQIASRLLYPRVGPRRLVTVCLVGMAVVMTLLTQINSAEDFWWLRLLLLCLGTFVGQVFVSTQAAAFATVSHAHTSHASSLYNSQRQLGSAIGVALLATVLNAVGTVHLVSGRPVANLAAYHVAFLAAAVLALVGSALSSTIHDADAAVTMVRRSSQG
jgi:EmrB/QacA subfamily drug resistance transporter